MRIGLNSGDVIAGAMGSDMKLEYTTIGETTNLADDPQHADTLAEPHDERRGRRAGFSVHGQPVELHGHGVRDWVVRENGPLLENDAKVPVYPWQVWPFRVDYKKSEHPHHFLHGHVRMIKIRPVLMEREFIDEFATRRNGRLRDPGHAVHPDRDFQAVPVDAGEFGQPVLEDNPHRVPFLNLDAWARHHSVVSPDIKRITGKKLPFGHLRNEMKDLHAVLHLIGKLGEIGLLCGKTPDRDLP